MSILVTAIRSGNLDVVKEKFSRPVRKLTPSILNFIQLLILWTLSQEQRLTSYETISDPFGSRSASL